MGDLRDWSPEPNSGVLEDRLVVSSSLLLSLNQTVIASECWQVAEEATRQIISQVQPTVVSEIRRKRVIDYVQRLIRGSLGCEVFPFGSVPLRTYLPDGDIDLTAFGGLNLEEALANDVYSILEREEQNSAVEFVVRDVQLIRAEVKLVKCLIQNIVVDISFNQLGGVCTLCFLEKVDGLIGKDHLFKRSIILIKAWCYYESRILGAHHGLISTYALETLVLYIFHLFHSSLNGPLGVLYTFLDYFSKFDWENYCISLNGPVRISSLPEIIVETPENDCGDLLLSNEFVKECVEMFSVPSRGFETVPRAFPLKHLNIVDPLKETNNLGRSVTKGNFYRIRSAFTYGARKLGVILSRSEENIGDGLHKFFSNTLDRHGSGQRPDVQDPIPHSVCNGFVPALPSSGIDSFHENLAVLEPKSADLGCIHGECSLDHEESLCNGEDNISGMEMRLNGTINEQDSIKVLTSTKLSEPDSFDNRTDISENHLSRDAKNLATSRSGHLMNSDDTPKLSSPSGEESISPRGKAHHAPHLYFSPSPMGNLEMRNGIPVQLQAKDFTENVFSRSMIAPAEETCVTACSHQDETEMVSNCEMLSLAGSKSDPSSQSLVGWSSKDVYPGHPGSGAPSSIAESPEALNSLSDLNGDYDRHLSSLQYGRWCFDYALGAIIPPIPPSLLSQIQSKYPWDAVRQSVQLKQNAFSQMNARGVVPSPAFYRMNPPLIPGTPFGMEELPKPRGTGTYFPNVNHYNDRSFAARGRNQPSARSPRSNGRGWTSPETNLSERSSRGLTQSQFLVHQGGTKNSGYLESFQSGSPRKKVYSNANGSSHPFERVVEFGSVGPLSPGMTLECSKPLSQVPAVPQNTNVTVPTPETPRSKSVLSTDQNRISLKSYHLKDEDDFPPLSG